ncbi:MAG: hypothetical protein M5T61_19835 [Acidimicrobiia bacterium]|nr:hypothetical protein [Acidimicrobiia bacterium]
MKFNRQTRHGGSGTPPLGTVWQRWREVIADTIDALRSLVGATSTSAAAARRCVTSRADDPHGLTQISTAVATVIREGLRDPRRRAIGVPGDDSSARRLMVNAGYSMLI